jgi:hypothetical protein
MCYVSCPSSWAHRKYEMLYTGSEHTVHRMPSMQGLI